MPTSRSRSPRLDREAAEAVALQGLAFLLEDPARAAQFLKLTGMQAEDMRERVGSVELMRAVLEHLDADESLLLVFAATRGVPPERVGRAIVLLEGREA